MLTLEYCINEILQPFYTSSRIMETKVLKNKELKNEKNG